MASGLFALLDDISIIARAAAASLDDIAAATAKAGAKSAGVVIDDAAVTPAYVTGFTPDRELPIIWKIAKGSLRNKLLILLPVFVALAAFFPQGITPVLMVGGAYLCFEAAEKVMEKLGLHHGPEADTVSEIAAADHEKSMVSGAIRTDLILSAEILAIALGELNNLPLTTVAAALAGVSVAVTILVYGVVGLIVKMDDVGLRLARTSSQTTQALGRAMVTGMPSLLTGLSVIGTAAMAWVGGGIVLHGMDELGLWPQLPHLLHDWAHAVSHTLGQMAPTVNWIVNAFLAGIFGLIFGAIIAQFVNLVGRFLPGKGAKQNHG